MRDIKFRAWNECSQPYWEYFDFIELRSNDARDRHYTHWGQFTGLKDKNGREIYEGDIISTSNTDPQWDIWDKEDCGYTVVKWDDESDSWVGSKWTWDKSDESVYGIQFCEVIGNIHENPELLKEGRE